VAEVFVRVIFSCSYSIRRSVRKSKSTITSKKLGPIIQRAVIRGIGEQSLSAIASASGRFGGLTGLMSCHSARLDTRLIVRRE
jgi:hypothetical protein